MKWKILLLVVICCGWFHSIGSWNQLSRYDAIRALAESGTVCIDDYLANPLLNDNTGDWSRHDGHYYSNKAPLPILLGAAVYAPFFHLERAAGLDYAGGCWQKFNFWWINFWCSVLPTALAALFLFKLLREMAFGRNRALFWSLALALASPLWPYATQMWGHNLAAFCLAAAFYHALRPGGMARDAVLAGLYGGAAVLADYLAVTALPFLAAYLYFAAPRRDAWWRFILGGMPMLAIHGIYHYACFGNPVLPATFYNNPVFINPELAGGIFSSMKPVHALELLVGIRRGLLWCAPLAFLAFPAAWRLWRQGGVRRHLAFATLGGFLAALAVNSSFNGWHGGACIGPRYLLIALPALFILAAHCRIETPMQKWLAGGLGCLSAMAMMICATATPLAGEELFNPLFTYIPRQLFNPFRQALTISPGALAGWRPWSDLAMLAAAGAVILHWMRWPILPPKPVIAWNGLARHWRQLLPIAPAAILLVAFPSLTQFIFDEPMLIDAALRCNTDGVFATSGLQGTVGQNYGSLPINCYQLMLLFTRSPIILVSLKAILFAVTVLWGARRITRLGGAPMRFLAPVILYSPCFWLWSRTLWDNVFQIPLSILSIACYLEFIQQAGMPSSRPYDRIRPLGLALLFAIGAVWVHTMSIAFLLAMPLHLAICRRDLLRGNWRLMAATALPAAILLGSFMYPRACATVELRRAKPSQLQLARETVPGMLRQAAAIPRLLSNLDIYNRQSDTAGNHVGAYMDETAIIPPAARTAWRALIWLTFAAGALLTLSGLAAAVMRWRRKPHSPSSQPGMLAIIIIAAHVLFLCALRPQFFPHYLQPAFAAVAILAAMGADAFRLNRCTLAAWCAGAACATALLMSQLWRTDGQFLPPVGMTLRTQWRAARTVAHIARQSEQFALVNMTWQYSNDKYALAVLLEMARQTAIPAAGATPLPPCRLFLVNPAMPAGTLRVIREGALAEPPAAAPTADSP